MRGLSPGQVYVLLIEAALSTLLGILLLVAGRLVLADSTLGPRLALFNGTGLALSVVGAALVWHGADDFYGQIGIPTAPIAINFVRRKCVGTVDFGGAAAGGSPHVPKSTSVQHAIAF